MLINIYGAKCIGIVAHKVTVEVDITSGIGIHLVGLADAAVKESLLRTVTALGSIGYHIPGKKIVINLAPADMHKNGSGYDLPIAMGILAASGQIGYSCLDKYIIMGELGLDASVRVVPGALPMGELARNEGFDGCILPYDSAVEAADFTDMKIYGVKTLDDVIDIVSGEVDRSDLLVRNDSVAEMPPGSAEFDFAEIVGQESAKRGLEIAAAGGHNVIMVGPPGSGKSSLAKALAGILPPMSAEEALQTCKIYSVAGRSRGGRGIVRQRPYRAPHISASVPALIGGGTDNILPGEISLAHNGVLMLDEFCEAPKRIIEILRAPMEDRKVTISRLRMKVEYPASFMLVAASNPCPCGYYGEGDRCTCSVGRREAYLNKLSGPVMDRIDLHLWLRQVNPKMLMNRPPAEKSEDIAKRVLAAREIQRKRFDGTGIFTNSEMDSKLINQHCRIDEESSDYLEKLMVKFGLSARACTRILKIARTIADLDASEQIRLPHLAEASSYRFLDKASSL